MKYKPRTRDLRLLRAIERAEALVARTDPHETTMVTMRSDDFKVLLDWYEAEVRKQEVAHQ